MKTKGMKIIDNIARTFKRPMELDDIVRASNDARSAGGSFTANDVAEMLRWAFNVAIDATGNRDALRGIEEHYNELCAQNRQMCRKELEEAFERAERAEQVASEEYQRARDEMEDELRRYRDRADEFEEKAEWYDNLEENTPADIFDAIVEKDWREATFQDAQDIAEKIRECGRAYTFSGALAV